MTDKELKDLAYGLFDSIYITKCYGVNDLIRLNMAFKELEKRGYETEESQQLKIKKTKWK